jgi:hypothetical protein
MGNVFARQGGYQCGEEPMKERGVAWLGGFAAIAAVLSGCATSTTTRIYVDASAKANSGRVMHLMVREGIETLVTETYQDVAAKLFAQPPDPAILDSQPVFPGDKVSITIKDGENKDIVVYFFFTDPDGEWRVPLQKPLPAEVFIELGERRIERTQARRR